MMPEPPIAIAEDYARRLSRMRTLHDGESLAEAANAILHELPDGPLYLLSTSAEGVALVAVLAALRTEAPTRWERVVFSNPRAVPAGYRPVVVEPEDGGAGWRHAIESRYPGAAFVVGSGRPVALTA